MLTAADVSRWVSTDDEGVTVAATVGLGLPVLAAVPPEIAAREADEPVGTINLLVVVPVPLSDAALVNAVVTATEAKAQALAEAGLRATGTSSDAVCVACPDADVGGARAVRRAPLVVGRAHRARRARCRRHRHRGLVLGSDGPG